jgi:hypothetical protein
LGIGLFLEKKEQVGSDCSHHRYDRNLSHPPFGIEFRAGLQNRSNEKQIRHHPKTQLPEPHLGKSFALRIPGNPLQFPGKRIFSIHPVILGLIRKKPKLTIQLKISHESHWYIDDDGRLKPA